MLSLSSWLPLFSFILFFPCALGEISQDQEESQTPNIFDEFFPKPNSRISKLEYEDFLLRFLVDTDHKSIGSGKEVDKDLLDQYKLMKVAIRGFLETDERDSYAIEDIQADLQTSRLMSFLNDNLYAIFLESMIEENGEYANLKDFMPEPSEFKKMIEEEEKEAEIKEEF